jgi:hypothetical protein
VPTTLCLTRDVDGSAGGLATATEACVRIMPGTPYAFITVEEDPGTDCS